MNKEQNHSFVIVIALLLVFTSCNEQKLPAAIPTEQEVGAQAMPHEIAPIVGAPFRMEEFQRPEFPDYTVSITERGGKESEPITGIINSAIAEVSDKKGGTVVVPAGKWKSGRIILKSNVNLHFAEGAEVEFSDKVEDYLPAVFTRQEGIEIMGPGACIHTDNETNIAITGKGTLWGPPMDSKMRDFAIGDTAIEHVIDYELAVSERVYDGISRRVYVPKMIAPVHCKNVFIEGITLERSIFWNINPIYCNNIIIRGVTVNSTETPSGDGIDIESCSNVLIEYCTMNNNDDCYTLKSGRGKDGIRVGKPTENVVIRYSLAVLGHGGITCGSETAGNIKNIYAHDCVFKNVGCGIRFKTRRPRGGGTESVLYERIRMINVGDAFRWDLLGSRRWVGELADRLPLREINELTPIYKNIHVRDFIVESSGIFLRAQCIPEAPLKNVLIENGEVNTRKLIPELNDVEGFTLRNLTINSANGDINILDGRNVTFDNVRIQAIENQQDNEKKQ